MNHNKHDDIKSGISLCKMAASQSDCGNTYTVYLGHVPPTLKIKFE